MLHTVHSDKVFVSLAYRESSSGSSVTATYILAVPSHQLSCKDPLKVLFYQMLSDFRKCLVFWKAPRLFPFVPLTATCR